MLQPTWSVLFLWCFLVHFFSFSGVAQRPEPEHVKFRMSEGLQGNNYLYQLTRDSKGFIWVSAQSGLSYYDGNEFHRYEARHGLPDHNVLRTFEDPHHTIWLQTYSGDLLRVANDTLLPYRYNETIRHLLNTDRVWHFGFDSVGNLYLGHNMRGLWQVDTSGQLSNLIAFEDGVARVSIWRSDRCPPIGFRTRKDLGTAVPETLTIYNENLEIETEIPLEHDPVNPNRRVFYNTCQDGALAVVYGGDLFKISPDGNYQHNRQPLLYNGVMEDRAGNLWTASFGYGLMGFPNGYLGPASPETDTTFFISILPRNFFHSIIEDHEGGFWMGSFTNGLFYISDPQLEKIILSKTEPDRNYLYSLTQSKDRLFAIATSKTLLEVNAQGTQRHEFWEALFDQPGGTFSSLYWHAPQKRLYLGHKKQLLYLEASEHFKQLHELKLPNQRPIRIIQSGIDSGYFWVSDRLSIFRISPLGVETAPVTLGHYTTAFQEMPDGSLWSGSEKGLFYQSGDTMKHFEHASPLVNSRINTLYQHEGKLWMTNVNKGCAILSKDSLILFDDKEFGLIIPYGYWPEQDTMWAASGKDLVKFVCYPNDSITVEKFPVLKDENTRVMDLRFFQGHFYIATTSGLLKLKRSFTQKLIPPPPVYLTGLQINDRDTSLQAHYDLPYHQNRLRLNFTGLSFRSPPTHYRYRLTGLDSAWHMIRQPSTQFTELSPGRYVFEVHALTKDGKWSEVPASLSFIIHPPFWATWWFLLAIGMLLVVLIVGFIQWRIGKARQHLQVEQQLLRLESKALRAQINPHFIFNVLGAIQGFVALGDTQASEIYLGKFARLIRLILENSRESVVSLQKELETLRHYLDLEQARFREGFEYHMEVDDALDLEATHIPAMLIQPYLENAIIHGLPAAADAQPGVINIRLHKENQHLRCEIRDFGKGVNAPKSPEKDTPMHRPLGMLITRERLALLNQKLPDEFQVKVTNLHQTPLAENGTLVELTIPIHL